MKIELDIFKKDKNVKDFYCFEGKLATEPILCFLNDQAKKTSGTLVDFGCGKKIYRSLFNNVNNYIGIDLFDNNADLSEDIKKTSLPSNYADYALCNQVIEHDMEPEKIIIEIHRVLKTNGVLFLSAPQMGRLHGEPYDYYRFTKYGLQYILQKNGFTIDYLCEHGGFFRAFGSHINFLICEKWFYSKYYKIILRHTIIIFNNIIFPILDKLIKFKKDTLGYNIIAIKRGEENG